MAEKKQHNDRNEKNSVAIPIILTLMFGTYLVKEFILPIIENSGQNYRIQRANDTGIQPIQDHIILTHNQNEIDVDNGPVDDVNTGSNGADTKTLKTKTSPQPEARPINPKPKPKPPKTQQKAKSQPPLTGLGNFITDVIDNITPFQNRIFYYSEQDIIDNERIFIKRMSGNKGFCKIYQQQGESIKSNTPERKIYY